MTTPKFLISASVFIFAASCAHKPEAYEARKIARAPLEARSGSTISGNAEFAQVGGDVVLTVAIIGATPGKHAVHIHVTPDCTDAEAKSAGDHWNPSKEHHGQFDVSPFHLGDIGNIDVGPGGSGELKLTTNRWSIGTGDTNDVTNHAIVVHAAVDDLKTDPTGNAGSRQACGVISLTSNK